MLISPPFLQAGGQADGGQASVDEVMLGGTLGQGSFPVSLDLSWHGGLHLIEPGDGTGAVPVRAIADGTVVYARKPSDKPSQPTRDDPLNYYTGWTSDGCVVIRHTTEIGEGDGATLTYYSIYMHLSELAEPSAVHSAGATIKAGDAIWRKDRIGKAGYIYGQPGKLHFEIVLDDANLKNLIGRAPDATLDTSKDGRIDSVWGEVYVVLPSGTAVHSDDLRAAQREAHVLPREADAAEAKATEAESKAASNTADQHLHEAAVQARAHATSLRSRATAATTRYTALQGHAGAPTSQLLIVGLRYSGGGCSITTYQEDASEVGTALSEAEDYEYNLFQEAMDLYPGSPSAGYELLRFGRVLGPDALSGSDTAHWRQINVSGGQGWVNLNATGVSRFSDADFPPWKRWCFAADDIDGNSRCDSTIVKRLILEDGTSCYAESTLPQRFTDDAVQRKLQRAVCKIPSEWDGSKIDERWGWLKQDNATDYSVLLNQCMSEAAFARLKAHITKLAFWADAGLPEPAWHINPREFIRVMQACGWLSLNETAELLPRISYTDFPASTKNRAAIPWATAHERWSGYYVDFNKMMRKYGLFNAKRQTQILAQIYIETALVRTMREIGYGQKNSKGNWPQPAMEYYYAFYGRGMMQLTWAFNYEAYREYRTVANLPDNSSGDYVDYPDRPERTPSRITQTSLHYWTDPRHKDKTGKVVISDSPRLWYPRYDPDLIASSSYNACDSAGFYWVSKKIGGGQTSIVAVADRDFGTESIGRCSVLVNGGGYGYHARQGYARYVWRYRSDSIEDSKTDTVSISYGTKTLDVSVDYTRQKNEK